MTYKEMRQLSGMTQQKFADFFCVPKRTIENWDAGKAQCKQYLIDLFVYRITHLDQNFERCYFNVKDLRIASGMTQKVFREYFGFAVSTLEAWEGGRKQIADYVLCLMEYKLYSENRIK